MYWFQAPFPLAVADFPVSSGDGGLVSALVWKMRRWTISFLVSSFRAVEFDVKGLGKLRESWNALAYIFLCRSR